MRTIDAPLSLKTYFKISLKKNKKQQQQLVSKFTVAV